MILSACAGYAIGSLPLGYLAGRRWGGVDLRAVGSRNVGATNMYRVSGPRLGLLVMLVVGMLVFILYCWFQAGTLAVLLAGEAQAPVMRMAPSVVFRTFTWAGFVGWASRYGLRIFWINNLFLMLLTLLMFVFALPFLASAWLSSEEEFSAVGCVVGCGLAVPLGFVALVLVLAMMVAQICAVQEGATTLGATRRAFSIAGRRLGGLLLLYLLMIVGSIAALISLYDSTSPSSAASWWISEIR